jgi:hypothetical protein
VIADGRLKMKDDNHQLWLSQNENAEKQLLSE